MRVGAICKHRNIIQEQIHLGSQSASRRAVRRFQAHRKTRSAEHAGKRARGTAAPIVDGLAPKDVASHCGRHPVQQRCEAAPQPGRFRQLFQEKRSTWLGREGSNLRMAESKSAALPLGYAPSGTKGMAEERATADSLWSQPVYRLSRGISTARRGKKTATPGGFPPDTLL